LNILFVTDTWRPHINGVVRSLEQTIHELEQLGHNTKVIGPGDFRTLQVPRYPDLDLVFPGVRKRRLKAVIGDFIPDHIHIATEGFLGMSGRRYARYYNIPISTAYHTQIPMYLKKYFYIPQPISYTILRRFHNPKKRRHPVMVSTLTMKTQLESKGFKDVMIRPLGFDSLIFFPRPREPRNKPVLLFAGRVAIEKNIKAFLALDALKKYDLVVVGDGPKRKEYEREYPNVTFLGMKIGPELADVYSYADVLVFPSLTDTFGMVIIEAMACGTPVAAYPAPGPIDIIEPGLNGAIDQSLAKAVDIALKVDREQTASIALMKYSWQESTRQFIEVLHSVL
jgi:glycosyltransferase involved in cell wall biosynthesis